LLLFGDEEHVDRWCAARRTAKGAVVPLAQVWQLARMWYAGRALESWNPRTPEQAEHVFAGVGLHGDFWRLTTPSRG
jgi:hypothetical protein